MGFQMSKEVQGVGVTNSSDPSSIPAPSNNFNRMITWRYTTYYDEYCTDGNTIPGEVKVGVAIWYLAEYFFFTALYIPALIVIYRSKLYKYACYKIMFVIGICDCNMGFIHGFLSGIYSLIGASYCSHNTLLILTGHCSHFIWGFYCTSAVLLALNRCIDMHSREVADRLFSGNRVWLWFIPILLYSIFFSSDYDVPGIYNSVVAASAFQIDFRPGAPPVMDWICFYNSCFVLSSLIILYSILLFRMARNSSKHDSIRSMQRKVLLQSFVICCSVFLVAATYGSASFIRIPLELAKCTTISVQICAGSTAIMYITMNKTIRRGVLDLIGIGHLTYRKSQVTALSTDMSPQIMIDGNLATP
ncbi:serpentine type 7TM GPCR chemoreceptor srt domain-containing protein [Ditylenchus destructor]|uniref:Serpentine type 7TM GPCR chemoreceptor srt domain-containing protein n=1 Tax=Ditylenchus destructor TaxID=166010 RepID=A0AAD4MRS8_9BILA|nr:serpentine type 7TM GPCR chemoreceptor srt domain-containing protein [Ditylenchus destructor]